MKILYVAALLRGVYSIDMNHRHLTGSLGDFDALSLHPFVLQRKALREDMADDSLNLVVRVILGRGFEVEKGVDFGQFEGSFLGNLSLLQEVPLVPNENDVTVLLAVFPDPLESLLDRIKRLLIREIEEEQDSISNLIVVSGDGVVLLGPRGVPVLDLHVLSVHLSFLREEVHSNRGRVGLIKDISNVSVNEVRLSNGHITEQGYFYDEVYFGIVIHTNVHVTIIMSLKAVIYSSWAIFHPGSNRYHWQFLFARPLAELSFLGDFPSLKKITRWREGLIYLLGSSFSSFVFSLNPSVWTLSLYFTSGLGLFSPLIRSAGDGSCIINEGR